MTDEQKKRIMDLFTYNEKRSKSKRCSERVQDVHGGAKAGIMLAISAMGYSMVFDNEGRCTDIVEKYEGR